VVIDEFALKRSRIGMYVPWQDLLSPEQAFEDAHVCPHWTRMLRQHHHHQILSPLDSEGNVSLSHEKRQLNAQTWKSKEFSVIKAFVHEKDTLPMVSLANTVRRTWLRTRWSTVFNVSDSRFREKFTRVQKFFAVHHCLNVSLSSKFYVIFLI